MMRRYENRRWQKYVIRRVSVTVLVFMIGVVVFTILAEVYHTVGVN